MCRNYLDTHSTSLSSGLALDKACPSSDRTCCTDYTGKASLFKAHASLPRLLAGMKRLLNNLRSSVRKTLPHLLVFALLGCIPDVSPAEIQFVTADTKYGEIKGSVLSFANNSGRIKSVKFFQGVPFASAPIRELRFKPPKPPTSWRPYVYDTTRFKNVCLQGASAWILSVVKKHIPEVNDPRSALTEDCLYLNIAEPGEAPTFGKYPVIVYIHGGGFILGTTIISPGYLLALREVVVVSVQYRLGPFGFLSTNDQMAQGNQGLLDQVLALKWVQENIENFNGDPDRVTIFGTSAGAASVAMHMLSPLSTGLFHSAISISAVALTPWATCGNETAMARTKTLARTLNCDREDSRDMVTCLQGKEAWLLMNASVKIAADRKSELQVNFPWCPVVDGEFIPDEPAVLRREGRFNKVPYIAGITSNEYAFFLGDDLRNLYGITQLNSGINETIFQRFTQDFAHMIQPSTRYGGLLTDAVQFQYFPWPRYPPHELNAGLLQKAIDLGSDFYYLAPTQESLLAHSELAPAYMFVFDHRSSLSQKEAWRGVAHADYFRYIFGEPIVNQQKYDARDKNISEAMVTLWTNFAKYSNPTPPGRGVFGASWEPFNRSNQVYLRFGGERIVEMKLNYRGDRAAFWNYYYPKLMNESPECATVTTPAGGGGHVLYYCITLLCLGLISALMVT